jgi:hypothetical protein
MNVVSTQKWRNFTYEEYCFPQLKICIAKIIVVYQIMYKKQNIATRHARNLYMNNKQLQSAREQQSSKHVLLFMHNETSQLYFNKIVKGNYLFLATSLTTNR